MLVIRSDQMKAFEQAVLRDFEDEMLAHSQAFTPRLAKVLGDEQLRQAVRSAIARAMAYGFTNRGPIRLYLEMMFLFGSGFDTDPQYPWAAAILTAPDHQMIRAEQLFEKTVEYHERVSGTDAENTWRALRRLSEVSWQPATEAQDFARSTLELMTQVFPEKVGHVGDQALLALAAEGEAVAERHGLTSPRGKAVVVALMFSFGHGCTDDPLYPWIAQTLRDERILGSEARTARLERKALTWRDHVLASDAARS